MIFAKRQQLLATAKTAFAGDSEVTSHTLSILEELASQQIRRYGLITIFET